MMSAPPERAGPARRALPASVFVVLAGLPMALAIGLAAGAPVPEFRTLGLVSLGIVSAIIAGIWPWIAVQVLFFSSFFLICYLVTETRAANAIDVLLFPVFFGSLFGGMRATAKREIASRTRPEHAQVEAATKRLSRAALAFYGVAAVSLLALALRGHTQWAFDSTLSLVRALQGISYFALGLWWFRTERHLRVALRTVELAAWGMIVVNTYYFITLHIGRAGQTWIVNNPDWPITSPNDAGLSILIVWALLQALPEREKTLDRRILMGGLIVLLVMTQSRSGLLAWSVYNLLTLRWLRWRTLFSAAAIAGLAVAFVPESYWSRISKTIAIGGGSFEAYTSLIRVYAWQVALRVFLDNPVIGVGYLGFRFVSSAYNDLRIVIATSENFYLEVAADMGVPGVIALVIALASLLRLGPAIRRVTPPGSFGHTLATRHTALILSLFVVLITGNNLVGMTALSQLSIWCALLVRAGHLAIESSRS